MEVRFEDDFLKALRKHSSIRKLVKKKVDMIIENPVTMGEPLKDNWRGFYSCPVKRNFIIIYLYCAVCRKKGDDKIVGCSDCSAVMMRLSDSCFSVRMMKRIRGTEETDKWDETVRKIYQHEVSMNNIHHNIFSFKKESNY